MFWVCMAVTSVLSVATRFYDIELPRHVCWDEAHFGRFASNYLNRKFFFDVHPPFGKLLTALAGHVTHYDGSFTFEEPGDPYGDTKYLGMRMVCAGFACSIPVLVFGTVHQLTHCTQAAFLAALLLIFDTGTLILSQYILLDPFLLCFLSATVFSYVKFTKCNKAFTVGWWFWLTLTGVCLSLTTGVKLVGLFMVTYVGLSTIAELWNLLGDVNNSIKTVAQHFFARAVCLIIVPVSVYCAIFEVHFRVLNHSGTGDGFYSSAFQSQLIGNPLHNASRPQDVAFGSVVTLKNQRIGGAYLHSHWHLYPDDTGPRQQQVTCYNHKDQNNHWLVKREHTAARPADPVQLVSHGAHIRLEHVWTKRNLHSHRHPAAVTPQHQQVSCYGQNGTGDANDVFRIEIDDSHTFPTLKAMTSLFRLIHVNSGCALASHNVVLPKWGWEQFEVTCTENTQEGGTLWNIEEVFDNRLPNVSFSVYAPNFFSKLIESHAVMILNNNGLLPKEEEVTSLPWQWPINYRGQPFSSDDYRIYQLGNPVIFWANLVMLFVYSVIYAYDAFKEKRGRLYKHSEQSSQGDSSRVSSSCVLRACNWLFVGWLLHYAPFWCMSRVLYFHHYFPAFLFSCMISGIICVYLVERISCCLHSYINKNYVQYFLHTFIHSGIIYSFYLFSPLAYGMSGETAEHPDSPMHGLQWLSCWDI